ncbi:hypothetical protein BDN71DRAFT_1450438 [Pleurotus eryngii]|uniref:DUF7918 domain-containing protein n=1 Tax=Pleurotus eryngii TaxID=5323 RepID=A0A9P6D5C9_PLEER|nr:hypothetical protein BDN71DRAFT_1450438 [Pleurotus eryngii]
MLQLEKFSAWVTIDGEETPEYNVEISDDGTETTCWIASQVNKPFEVHWRAEPNHSATAGDVRVDGKNTSGQVVHPSTYMSQNASVKGVPISLTQIRPLMFSTTELTDDDSYLNVGVSPELGSIVLEINNVVVTDAPSRHELQDTQFESKVHERSKKLGAHSARLGEPEYKVSKYVSIRRYGRVASFTFRYRPLDILQAQSIVPPPNSSKRKADNTPGEDETDAPVDKKRAIPEVIELDDDGNEDVESELKALRARMELLKAKQVKKERAEPSAKRVKREHKPVLIQGEIIDLT